MKIPSLLEKFESRVLKIPFQTCWKWSGAINSNGYAMLHERGQHYLAYRWYYEQTVGKVPKGLQLDHLCRNRACVNPLHLEPVTPKENQYRSPISLATINSAKTHCPKGHEYNEANTVYRNGDRFCKTCKDKWIYDWYHNKKKHENKKAKK